MNLSSLGNVCLAGMLTLAAAMPAFAQSDASNYPNQAIRVIVPYPPGGGSDFLARLLSERVQARWAEHGFSWWSFFDRDSGEIVGAGCIQHLARIVTEPLEIGWRLRTDQWGKGLANEAAHAMGDFAFRT